MVGRNIFFGLLISLCAFGGLFGCASKGSLKKSEGYYREGLAFLDTDRQRAFISFQKSIQINQMHKEAHYYLGHLYARQGKYHEAERALRRVLEIDSEYSEAHTYLGQVLVHRDKWGEAIQSYRKALENPLYITPDLARFHLGKALAHEGAMEEAIQAYENALLVSPMTVPPEAVHLELGRAYYKLGEDGKAREALVRVTSLAKEGAYAEAADLLLGRLRP